MRLFGSGMAAVLAATLVAVSLPAQTPPPAEAHRPRLLSDFNMPGLTNIINFDVVSAPMDMVDFLRFLALRGNLNIILSKEVSGQVKLMVKEVTLGDALEIALAANNLSYEVKGNIIKIMTDKEYRDLYGQGFYDSRQMKVVELKYANPEQVAKMLEPVKSTIGKIVYDLTTGTLILIDTPERIQAMEPVIARTEIPTVERIQPTQTQSFVLQYGTVEDVQAGIATLLSKDFGKIRSDKRTKTLIVTDLPQNLEKIAELVALFDQQSRQVFIEAKIVQLSLTKENSLGVKWEHVMNTVNPRASISAASAFPLRLGSGDSGATLKYNTIAAGGDLSIVIQALEKMGDVKILSNPHIAAQDGEQATIKVVTDQPYSEVAYEGGTTNVTAKTYKFIPVGVTLKVTPRINDEGFITMKISPESSTISDWYDGGGMAQHGVPVVKKSFAETSVAVKDGVTIIIAGMIEEQKNETVTGLPGLSRIPLLGVLFRSKSSSLRKVETIVFLTPRIVTGAERIWRDKDLKAHLKQSSAEDSKPDTEK